jgi:hypothetical protein
MKNAIIISVLSVLLTNCRTEKQKCARGDFKELDLKSVQISVKIPPYQIVDTTKYGPGRTILNYKITSLDSLLNVVVFIDDYNDYANEQLNIDGIVSLQKQEVETGQNDKKLLTEVIKDIDSLKVGYLKYLVVQASDKFYASRIFFYKDKKLIVLWLFDRNVNEKLANRSISDCVLESLIIY